MSDTTPPPTGGSNGGYESTPPPQQPPGGYGSYGGGTPPPPPPGYGGSGYGGPGYGAPQTNKKSIWALVLGIVGLLCCGLFAGIPALILGRQAQKEIDASAGAQTGRGMATAGFVLGIIAIVWTVIYLILVLTGAINFGFSTSP
jgi:hypothetical protein